MPVTLAKDMQPIDAGGFERGLAEAIDRLMQDAEPQSRMGAAGRRRAVEAFGWSTIAERTVEVYRSLAEAPAAER